MSTEGVIKLLEKEGYDLSQVDVDGIIDRLVETGKESLISMAMLPVPGAAIDLSTGQRNLITIDKLTKQGYGQEQAEQLLYNMKHGETIGEAHDHMVNQMVAKTHNETGGSTIDANTGKNMQVGYAVAIAGETEQIMEGEEVTPEQVAEYREKHKDLLEEHPALTVGTWAYEGKTYMDLSFAMPSKPIAMQMADEQQQLAIYDLEQGEEIMVPTYESLLERAYEGDAEAVTAIQNGKYRTEQLQAETPFTPEAKGFEISEPSPNYNAASDKHEAGTIGEEGTVGDKGGQRILPRQNKLNPWVRQSKNKSNKGRTLVVQISSQLINEGKEDPQATAYYDKLYRNRKGYFRGTDFWEVPDWIAQVTNTLPDVDLYVVRNVDEAIAFLNEADYDTVAFSALNVNQDFIKQIAAGFEGELSVGGYVGAEAFADNDNVTWFDSIEDLAKSKEVEYSPGSDYRLFKEMKTIPRLCMSKGCKHMCAMCSIPKDVTATPKQRIQRQVEAMADLDSELIYLDDKTFGQADNYEDLIEIYNGVKQRNPKFRGFIIQTTAAQMTKLSDDFLKKSGIKYIELGVESFNDSVLREIHKPASEELITKAVQRMRENNISFIPNIIIGFPQETAETYTHTLEFIEKNMDVISHINIYNLALYEGTEMADQVAAETGEYKAVWELYEEALERELSLRDDVVEDFIDLEDNPAVKEKEGYKARVQKIVEEASPDILDGMLNQLVEDPETFALYGQDVTNYLKARTQRMTLKDKIESMEAEGKDKFGIDETDLNENQVAKSFHENPEIHMAFADSIYKMGEQALDKPSISEVDPASNWQKIKIHSLAKALGMNTKTRRAYMNDLVEKKSTKDMNTEEANLVISELAKRAKTEGVVTSTGDELAEHLRGQQGQTQPPGTRGVSKHGMLDLMEKAKQGTHEFFAGLDRIERLMEQLDGYEKGPLYHSIWAPVNRAVMTAHEDKAKRGKEFVDFVNGLTGGVKETQELLFGGDEIISEAEDGHPEIRLSPSEMIGVYVYSKNEDSRFHLQRGNFADHDNPTLAIIEVLEHMRENAPELIEIGDYILEEMEAQFERVNQAAILGLGREIEQQDKYFAMYFKDEDLADQQDFLTALLGTPAMVPGKLEIGEVKKRKKGARQPLRLDAVSNYFYHIDRIEQFVNMAPLASSIGSILKNKDFRMALNDATHGTGPKILDKWLHDSIRGFSAEVNSWMGKKLLTWRKNGMVYALAGKIPSVMRQVISITNALAIHPDVMAAFGKNMAIGHRNRNYKQLEERALSKSLTMRTRIMDPMMEIIGRGTSSEQKMSGKQPWSAIAMSWIRWSDRHTVVHAWNALYDAARNSEGVRRQFNLDGSDKMAIEFADTYLGRTQPMGGVQHLPDFYRGGVVERLLTTFQNQINNNQQFWKHEILGEYGAGKIDTKMMMYRVLNSYVLPAFMFGVIGRGGKLPPDWKGALFDQMMYALGPMFLFGRIVTNGVKGFDKYLEGVEAIWLAEAGKAVGYATKGEGKKAALSATKSVGAVTGYIPQQVFTTGKGAYDLYNGTTDDLRRLIWSEWSLGEDENVKTKKNKRAR
jgi:tRNA A37 methylthiotransferase MiaB